MSTVTHTAPGRQASMTEPLAPPIRRRVEPIDVVRGVIMIIMALDHTRDYFGSAATNPTDLAVATAPLFLTRWITHFCAPVFFLLTGTASWLIRRRRTTAGLSRFLVTRGLWLVFLELVVMRAILQFNVDYHVTIITVLWALGWSMIALAALVYLPVRAIAAIGAALVVGHNLFDAVPPMAFGALAPVWTVLHSPGVLYMSPGHLVILGYPLIPWIGVTALGYAMGALYDMDAGRRRAILLRLGLALTVAFVALRALNVYGDPRPWTARATPLFTVLSFLNVNKYPPSLLFLLMTLGPALLLLRAVDGGTPRFLRPALVIGRVPLFYFVVHFLVIHLLALAASLARYGTVRHVFESPTPDRYPITQPPGWPAPLPVVYLVWITVVLVLYPLCRWYGALKARRPDLWWLSYL